MVRKKKLLIGAHMSIAGGADKAFKEAALYGANVMQIFTANQRQWRSKTFTEKEISLWEETKKQTCLSHIMSHNSYLINLGSSNKVLLEKSRKAFASEIERCHQLQIDYLTFHPGAALGYSEKECLDTIVESLLKLKTLIKKGKTRLLLETTAGQGSVIGYKFEHLDYIIKKIHKSFPIGVCFDTCHCFAAGYDLRSKESWTHTLKEFDQIIGLNYLYAFHVNDSMHDLGSRKDRHANLGTGKMGKDCFKILMQHPKTKYLPKYLETPNGKKYWEEEIKLLKKWGEK